MHYRNLFVKGLILANKKQNIGVHLGYTPDAHKILLLLLFLIIIYNIFKKL